MEPSSYRTGEVWISGAWISVAMPQLIGGSISTSSLLQRHSLLLISLEVYIQIGRLPPALTKLQWHTIQENRVHIPEYAEGSCSRSFCQLLYIPNYSVAYGSSKLFIIFGDAEVRFMAVVRNAEIVSPQSNLSGGASKLFCLLPLNGFYSSTNLITPTLSSVKFRSVNSYFAQAMIASAPYSWRLGST
jgi:hypothetical protein